MKTKLLRFLNIQESESKKIFYFFLFSLFIQAGVAVGESVANSMFLIHIGVEQLSIIYMITPFLILFIYIPIYSFFTSRYGEDRFFLYSLVILIIVNIAIYFFIERAEGVLSKEYYRFVFYFLLLYTTVMVITLYTLVWNFIDRFFDIMDSKRVFSIFSAGTAIGAISGGLLVSFVSEYFSANILLICWSIFSIFAFFILLQIPKKFKSINIEEEEEEPLPVLKQIVTMFKNIKSSIYIMALSAVFFISIFLSTILEYEYMAILSKDQDVESLALLFGKLYIVVNIFNLVVNFFLFNRLVIRFGVNNILLIQPIAYLLAFAYLSVQTGLEAGIFGFFIVQGLLVSIDYNNQNLLYNGINSKIKYEVRTFIENLGEPFAIAFAGLFLFIISNDLSISQIAYIASAIALLYFILALILKYNYPIAMIKNLKSNWLDLTRNHKEIIDKIPTKDRDEIFKYQYKLSNTPLVVKFIQDYNAPQAIEILLNFLNTTDRDSYLKSEKILEDMLNSHDPDVMFVTIGWLKKNLSNLNILLKKELGAQGLISTNSSLITIDSTDAEQKCASSVSIFNSQYPQHFSKAMDTVHQLLHSKEERDIIEGLHILGKSKHTKYAFYASEFLNSSNQKIVIKALETIHRLANNEVNRLVNPMLDVFEHGSKAQRLLSIKILGRIKDTQSIILLLQKVDTLSAYEKYEILLMIEGMGLQSIPALVTVMVEQHFSYFARSIAGRSLGRLAFAQFKDLERQLILNEIEIVYKLLYFYKIVSSNQDMALLSKYFMDKQQVILEFIFEILSIGGNLPSFELMKTSLRSSNPKIRGNAIETIEQSTEYSIFKELLPLLDRRSIDDVMLFYKKNYKVRDYTIEDIIAHSFNSNSRLEVLIAISIIPMIDENYTGVFRQKLLSSSSSVIKRALFDKIIDNRSVGDIGKLEKVAVSKKLSQFNIFSLYSMLDDAYIQRYLIEDGSSALVSGISILLEGECFIGDECYKAGDFIGFDRVFSQKEKMTKSISYKKDIEILVIQESALINTIEIYPETGIGFL